MLSAILWRSFLCPSTWELSLSTPSWLSVHSFFSGNAEGHNLSNILNSQESGLKVNQPASFAIRLNGAKGKIDAKVHSPSGAVEECHVSELEPGKQVVWGGGPHTSTFRQIFSHAFSPADDPPGKLLRALPQTLFINSGVSVCQTLLCPDVPHLAFASPFGVPNPALFPEISL